LHKTDNSGLNVEQRKRLSIGVELVAKPEALIFLDEPTSGLDSQTAWAIVSLLKKLADHGLAILCTIHQPSGVIFQQFDRLLLLAKGGRTVYFGDIGENAIALTGYFERHDAVRCRPEENPAEWMLHVIGAAPGAHTDRDWVETWKQSSEFNGVQKELDNLTQSRHAASEAAQDTSYAASLSQQFLACTQRVAQQYWRTPTYIYSKLSLCFITVSQPLTSTDIHKYLLISVSESLHRPLLPELPAVPPRAPEPTLLDLHAPRNLRIPNLPNHARLRHPTHTVRRTRKVF
jgi:energy-coupling factor transporter ATP-binding protein EcfA2